MNIKELLEQVESGKSSLEAKRIKNKEKKQAEYDIMRTEFVYAVNAFCGNNISFEEVKEIAQTGEYIKGKSANDFYQTIGLLEAYDIMSKDSRKKNFVMTENVLKKTHKALYKGVNSYMCGKFRATQVYNKELGYMPPSVEDLKRLIEHFTNQFETSKAMFHPIELAMMCYKRIMDMQPFDGCNEQMAFLMANVVSLNNGYGHIWFDKEQADELHTRYKNTMKMEDPDLDSLYEMFLEASIKTQKIQLDVIESVR